VASAIFSGDTAATQTLTINTPTPLLLAVNIGGGFFNRSTCEYTAPATGTYAADAACSFQPGNIPAGGFCQVVISFYYNGAEFRRQPVQVNNTGAGTLTSTIVSCNLYRILTLNANDKLSVQVSFSASVGTVTCSTFAAAFASSWFEVMRIL